jgi:hypothetical protein
MCSPFFPHSKTPIAAVITIINPIKSQLATFTKGGQFQERVGRILSSVRPEDLPVCGDAMAKAASDGAFFIAESFHCTVGTKTG